MDIRKLQNIVVTALEDIKGEDIEVFNTTKITSLFDRVVIATGTSNRQVRALANNVHEKVKEAGGDVIGMEGEDSGEWVLVDVGDIVVHIMQPTVRAYYNLEELWQGKPSAAKRAKTVADADTAQPAASSEEAEAAPAPKKRAPAKRAKAADATPPDAEDE